MKNFIIIALTSSIIIGWVSMAKAGSNDLAGYDVYLRNQNDATDIFYYGEPLFTEDDLKLEFTNGKRQGLEESSYAISKLREEVSAQYSYIATLKQESYKNYECVMTVK